MTGYPRGPVDETTFDRYITARRREARNHCPNCRVGGFNKDYCLDCPMFALVADERERIVRIEQMIQSAIAEECADCPKVDKPTTEEELLQVERTLKQLLEKKKTV